MFKKLNYLKLIYYKVTSWLHNVFTNLKIGLFLDANLTLIFNLLVSDLSYILTNL